MPEDFRAEFMAIRSEMAAQFLKISELQVSVARLQEKDHATSDKLNDMANDIKEAGSDVKAIKAALHELKGGWAMLWLVGAGIGTVIGWVVSSSGFVGKLFGKG